MLARQQGLAVSVQAPTKLFLSFRPAEADFSCFCAEITWHTNVPLRGSLPSSQLSCSGIPLDMMLVCYKPAASAFHWKPHRFLVPEVLLQINKLTSLSSVVRRKFSWRGFISGIWWSFVFGVRSLWRHNLTPYSYFPNQCHGEVSWHNMHMLLHALPLFYVSVHRI